MTASLGLLSQVFTPIAGVFSVAKSTFADRSHFVSSTGTVTPNADGYFMSGACTLVFNLPSALTGNYWVECLFKETNTLGSFRPGFLSPTYTPNALRSRGMDQVFSAPLVAGSTQVRIITSGAGFAATLIGLQIHDMAATLALPADVIITIGQSNNAATTTAFPFVATQDGWSDKRLMYFPGADNTAHGTALGVIEAMRAPLQHQSMSGVTLTANMTSMGVSPAVAFAKTLLPRIAGGRRLVVIPCAVSGAGFGAVDAPWNPVGTNPVATNNFKTIVAQAMAALPATSTVRIMLDCSGEAETAADMTGVSALYNASRADLRDWLVTQGYAASAPPIVAINGPPDASRANQSVMLAYYRSMDALSGLPESLAYMHVVDRQALGVEDTTHANAASNRYGGQAAAALAIARGLM